MKCNMIFPRISLKRWLTSEEDVGSLSSAEFPGHGTIDARDMAISRSTFVSCLHYLTSRPGGPSISFNNVKNIIFAAKE